MLRFFLLLILLFGAQVVSAENIHLKNKRAYFNVQIVSRFTEYIIILIANSSIKIETEEIETIEEIPYDPRFESYIGSKEYFDQYGLSPNPDYEPISENIEDGYYITKRPLLPLLSISAIAIVYAVDCFTYEQFSLKSFKTEHPRAIYGIFASGIALLNAGIAIFTFDYVPMKNSAEVQAKIPL